VRYARTLCFRDSHEWVLHRLSLLLQVLSSELSQSRSLTQPSVCVYDEVDAHVGGRGAVAVARLLRTLCTHTRTQIICVTHSPILAAAAHRHVCVSKDVNGYVHTDRVRILDGLERERELVRMITGDVDEQTQTHTHTAVQLARSLLALSLSSDTNTPAALTESSTPDQ
jgi:DNA repair protein RecN (Recombination protein N)